MTLKNILDEVSSLGFESQESADTPFLNSLNRALRQIYSELQVTKRARIIATATGANLVCQSYSHKPFSTHSFKLSGAAYSFKASGIGEYTVIVGGEKSTVRFDSRYHEARGFISGDGEIVFSGELSYSVLDLCSFERIKSPREEDIPLYSPWQEYSLDEYISDFGSIIRAPHTVEGELEDYRLSDGILYLPSDYEGEIILPYIPYPREILGNLDEEVIDIPNSLSHLLPLLTSAYLWLDDDSDKAQYYMQLYASEVSRIRRYSKNSVGGKIINENGWA